MTERSLPTDIQADLERPDSPHAIIWFLIIQHPNFTVPVRIVTDALDYVLDGETYTGLPLSIQPISDADQSAASELRAPNIDRKIGAALETAEGRATVAATAYSTADFDLTQEPRVALGTPRKMLGYSHFELSSVTVNAVEITGRVSLPDYGQEPWPHIRATSDRAPGLFI